MLRQALSSSSRALRSAPRLATSSAPLLRSQFQNAPAATSLRAFQPVLSSRWYSDAKEAPAEGEKAEGAKEEANGESGVVAELKKSLETKEAEARDWKVRFH